MMGMKPSKLKPVLWPIKLVLTTVKLPSVRLTEVWMCAGFCAWPNGARMLDPAGETLVHPHKKEEIARMKRALTITALNLLLNLERGK